MSFQLGSKLLTVGNFPHENGENGKNGDITGSCSIHGELRRRSENMTAATLLHGATSENMTQAFEGLCAALTLDAPLSELINSEKLPKDYRKKLFQR